MHEAEQKGHMMRDRAKNWIHSMAVVSISALVLWGSFAGCSGAATRSDAAPQNDAQTLYQAILIVYQERGLEVDVASDMLMLVSSVYESVQDQLRRRVIARVVTFGRGVALNVSVEYQQYVHSDDEDGRWQDVEDDPDLSERAKSEETDIARSIERHFHRIR